MFEKVWYFIDALYQIIYPPPPKEVFLMGYHVEEDGTRWEQLLTVKVYTECN